MLFPSGCRIIISHTSFWGTAGQDTGEVLRFLWFKGSSQQACCVTQDLSQKIFGGDMARQNKEEQVHSVPVTAFPYCALRSKNMPSPTKQFCSLVVGHSSFSLMAPIFPLWPLSITWIKTEMPCENVFCHHCHILSANSLIVKPQPALSGESYFK